MPGERHVLPDPRLPAAQAIACVTLLTISVARGVRISRTSAEFSSRLVRYGQGKRGRDIRRAPIVWRSSRRCLARRRRGSGPRDSAFSRYELQ
jgi:hypothetical protein